MTTNKVEPGTNAQKEAEKLKKIDFKMISFTLAGKDYGINILKVKEIRKAGNFTKVPNTPVYLRGVDNLRGDIIPIIDLRVMFNLPAETKDPNVLENIIILRLEELILGIVVDTIEKVVGISSESIQAPHPIFGDINIKYISGVVQNEGRLYIILDVDRIFGQPAEPESVAAAVPSPEVEDHPLSVVPSPVDRTADNLDLQFISENLATFGNFFTTTVNQAWVETKMESWKAERKAKSLDFQFSTREEAEEFLGDFYSPYTSEIWPANALDFLASQLTFPGANLLVWNPGCGSGHETYSIALLIEQHFKGKNYKVWANDQDLLSISTAPSLAVSEEEVPETYRSFTVKSKTGLQFSSELKSHLLFEFHDVKNLNPFGEAHLIVARDLISFFKPLEQEKLISEFADKIKPGGFLVVGKNERVEEKDEWKLVNEGDWSIYQRV